MPNSENSPDTSNPTVAKLLEVDALLATQETELSAQLKSLQEKRRSLKTVIDLFAPTDTTTATPIATPQQTPVAEAQDEVADVADEQAEQPTAEDVAEPELDQPKIDTTADAKAPAAPATPKGQPKKNSSPASKKQSPKSSQKKTSKESETWQQYLRDEFNDATLSQAVSQVMQRHPKQVLETAAILDAIFRDEIPRQVRSKARERVSNVLSVGVKQEKWYRGATGSYSMEKTAV